MAKMMALASDVKISSASSLAITAQNAFDYIASQNLDIDRVAAIIDAKRRQFFVAVYERTENGTWTQTLTDSMLKAS